LAEYAEYGFDLEGLSLDPSPDENGPISSSNPQSFPHLPGAGDIPGGLGFSLDAQNRLKQQRDEADKKGHYEQGLGWAGVAGRGMGAWAPLPTSSKPAMSTSSMTATAWGTRAPVTIPMRKKVSPKQTSKTQHDEDNEGVGFSPPSSTWTFSIPTLSSSPQRTALTDSSSSSSSSSSSFSSSSSSLSSLPSPLEVTLESLPSASPNTKKNKKTMLLSSSSRRTYR